MTTTGSRLAVRCCYTSLLISQKFRCERIVIFQNIRRKEPDSLTGNQDEKKIEVMFIKSKND